MNGAIENFIYAKKGNQPSLANILKSQSSDTIYSSFSQVMNLTDTENYSELLTDTSKISILYDLAMDSTRFGYSSARNILHYVYENNFPEVIILPSTNISERKSNKKEIYDVKVYPNPFTSQITIEMKGTEDPCFIKLFNIYGTEVQNKIVAGNQNYIFSTSDLSAGLYMLQIIQKNKIIYSGKINHQKE